MCFCTKRHETHRFIITTQICKTDGFIRPVLRSKPNQSVRSLITWSIQQYGPSQAALTQVSVSPVLSSPRIQVLYFTTLLWQFSYFMFTVITQPVINTLILIIGDNQTDQLSSLWSAPWAHQCISDYYRVIDYSYSPNSEYSHYFVSTFVLLPK